MRSIAPALRDLFASEPVDLVRAALLIGRIECPDLDERGALRELDRLGDIARDRLLSLGSVSVRARIAELNSFVYDQTGFDGNRSRYDDIRNSLLHVVVDRKLGIPITLAVVYMGIARRAGLEVFGVAFPGHFLMRVPNDAGDDERRPLILDPFDGGHELDDEALRALLASHGSDDAEWSDRLLLPCTTRHIVIRMLNNLKRLYIAQRSFAQAWQAANLLIQMVGPVPDELRDRGLLSYHLDDFAPALEDLEAYLRLSGELPGENEERAQIRDHVHALRRRVASLN